ncbi:Crinkler (CRN) family protein [Phytophthora infestans T30-4]|uniref:Crinkler (CRN) family protein n=1 Tax=Phytophthora infestans (strain T30-4) TaxID=403677 RepID=D0NJ08_PHYIT|nr:Crinkler (CRN) family protein [Phytophthora infestans T30-4]EEY59526.1 Crinkler (CRN) family protein [Phytophthora infestans T30-4]|eukprot:XP_002900719.1 Crinkler (CRN) family protein [Phytophthora infestans T30-4]
MVKLFCCIVGVAGSAFSVEVDEDKTVDDLKEAIKAKKANDFKEADADKLQLFLAKAGGNAWLSSLTEDVKKLKKGEKTALVKSLTQEEKELQGEDPLSECLEGMDPPKVKQIHVLVALPPGTSSAPISDGTDLWLSRFQHSEVAKLTLLPTRGDLNEFIGQPLPVKIGLPQSVFQAWSSPSILGQLLRDKLFELNDISPCEFLKDSVFSAAFLYPQVDGDATESAFHYFWDSIIRVVLGFVFRRAYVNRDSSRKSSSGLKRPDFLFALDHICVFRGEEKEPRTSITVPREELSKKLVWSYGGVPYVFGYAASGFELELFAIYQDVTGNVKTHLIGGFNLQHAPERFRLVLALLNLCLLFPAIVQNCPASAGTEFIDIHRANGVKVRLSPIFVDKNFHTQEEYRRVKRIYDSLKAYRIPCADAVVTVDSDQLRLTLKPRGVEMKPCSLSELFVALGNVLEALVVLHRNGWMHRDIRWSNVIKHIDRVEWFLIDFADAAQSPQKYPSGDHLTHDEHASDIFMEGGSHTTAVDLWAVGYLVKTSKIEREWTAEPERALFLDRLMNTDPSARPTADEALQLLSRFEREAAEQDHRARVCARSKDVREFLHRYGTTITRWDEVLWY